MRFIRNKNIVVVLVRSGVGGPMLLALQKNRTKRFGNTSRRWLRSRTRIRRP